MHGEGSTKPRAQKVTNQRAGWKMPLFLTLCLLQAANALKGPRLVSGEPGGAVTIKCHYASTSVNKYQRKYWCRLGPPEWICHTIVSTNHYTNHRYRGRVALEDFPQSSLFVVRLFQLSLTDEGYYRCGIGKRNDMLFFSMNLTVSAGPFSIISAAASKLTTRSLATASPVANRWTPGTTQTTEEQGAGWDKIIPTPGTRKTIASAKGRQPLGITRSVAPGIGSWAEVSIRATVPSPESRASKLTVISNIVEDVLVWSTRSSVANRARVSDDGRKVTTSKVDGPTEETRRVMIAPDATWEVRGTIRPSTLTSEKWAWENLQDAASISKQPAPGSNEETTRGAGVWTLGTTSIEMATVEGSTKGQLVSTAGDSGPQAVPSKVVAAGPLRPRGKGSSMKSSFPEKKSVSWILTPVSTVLPLVILLALVVLERKLWRKNSQEAERTPQVTLIQMTRFLESSLSPDQLPHMERKMWLDGSPPTHANLVIPARDPRP
ncbi:high affinity immunoglobulin alpha and immunoglobulin mu Fc receptor [Orycteropus afer afer]|uniref:high affinity immunoglobulin alpha and immunoglobulin mu Fc receptor n=1 Tax=Orycteropus afer afer TaxID=1230840 RepID=UPI001C5C8D31|nr:high affinity immunoglobulin alpha and immunoglobulin mu Fc receptor [Orycteropus afer afer]